ncbi:hypothetical protein EJV47_14745 [Hymenobacter gummosus]|uniref:Uncharacterized protein n=1 Tax=Hymenobacter gummosus TaxID=1776032 RepID=A0A431U173_9BACT|nr:hypothetical protein [Hymenobacter gummosus]RTQ48853.1 hypothetical protein EJV47_14745 [Hymenobacter gummosus]
MKRTIVLLSTGLLAVACEQPTRQQPAADPAAAAVATAATAAALPALVPDTIQLPDGAHGQWSVLQTGTFHHEEVPEDAEKQAWLGLFRGPQGYYVAPAPLRVKRAYDAIVDEDGEQTGWEVAVPGNADHCVLLLATQGAVPAGRTDTAAVKPQLLLPGKLLRFAFRGASYTLAATGAWAAGDTSAYAVQNYKLYLAADAAPGKRQLLAATPHFDDAMMQLVWIGDLDHDQRPDFILDTASHYNSSSPSVYLSSRAEGQELVKFVGQHVITGC